jgi:hypothetical protein
MKDYTADSKFSSGAHPACQHSDSMLMLYFPLLFLNKMGKNAVWLVMNGVAR